ncbi:hypothetical protein QBC46DRAFT_426266 [Diplogelasinospora grovesii]|uniref:FAD-binding PCMH-type domain-containing protein n=1 Tax=Diplogelasinospora grovesii TaxID=303347 RepID=A0AAN6NB09_9PEZI|nr:hypothetical protein QBC46DRAFT_426266 [Diplogelasinospora grovesii]
MPAAGLWTYFTNDTCRPTSNPTDTCTLGYYPVLVIMAKTADHIKAGIQFANRNNLRLIMRNTGHDFLGRSVGWGALAINTHSFQSVNLTKNWSGAGRYTGSAITVGAGVQAGAALKMLNAQSPPGIVVTGECATVGGFLADTALEFDVVTAGGSYATANANKNSDPFWALRGGGPASFAVIVSASYKTFTDLPSSGTMLNINTTHTTNYPQLRQAVSTPGTED